MIVLIVLFGSVAGVLTGIATQIRKYGTPPPGHRLQARAGGPRLGGRRDRANRRGQRQYGKQRYWWVIANIKHSEGKNYEFRTRQFLGVDGSVGLWGTYGPDDSQRFCDRLYNHDCRWHRLQVAQEPARNALKRELLDRGMSADEIATVIGASRLSVVHTNSPSCKYGEKPMFALPMDAFLLAQVAPSDRWTEVFFGLDPEQRFVLLIVGIGCATGIILGLAGIISGTMSSVHRRRIEADMKREMLDRGMSADEITKIIEAASPPEDATQRWIASWAKKSKR